MNPINRPVLRITRVWGMGLVLLVLRLVQNQTGFDPVTRLALPSAAGTAALAFIALCAVVELALCFQMPKDKADFNAQFSKPDKELTVVVLGCLLLAAGGILFALPAILRRDIASAMAGALAVIAGGGILLLVRRVRAGGELSVMTMIPALFFCVFFVLAVYLPIDNDPVLQRYYLPVLAVCVAAYAFSLLAGFLRKDSSPRAFFFVGDMAVILCVAALADGNLPRMMLFAGCAVTISAFLMLWHEPVAVTDNATNANNQ